jgi:hypothetical protein
MARRLPGRLLLEEREAAREWVRGEHAEDGQDGDAAAARLVVPTVPFIGEIDTLITEMEPPSGASRSWTITSSPNPGAGPSDGTPTLLGGHRAIQGGGGREEQFD